jgi:hypothetical protein
MESRFYILVMTSILTVGAGITSCNPPSKKVENEKSLKNNRDLNETATEFRVTKIATEEEWNAFKEEQELKMKEIELSIAKFREKMEKPEAEQEMDTTLQIKIVGLEQKKNILRAKIKSYESNQTDWITFKREIDNDMVELDKMFHELTSDNKDDLTVK